MIYSEKKISDILLAITFVIQVLYVLIFNKPDIFTLLGFVAFLGGLVAVFIWASVIALILSPIIYFSLRRYYPTTKGDTDIKIFLYYFLIAFLISTIFLFYSAYYSAYQRPINLGNY